MYAILSFFFLFPLFFVSFPFLSLAWSSNWEAKTGADAHHVLFFLLFFLFLPPLREPEGSNDIALATSPCSLLPFFFLIFFSSPRIDTYCQFTDRASFLTFSLLPVMCKGVHTRIMCSLPFRFSVAADSEIGTARRVFLPTPFLPASLGRES